MARRTSVQAPKQPAKLTPAQMTAGIERLKKRIEEVERVDPQSVTDQHNTPDLDALEAAIDETLVRTFGADTLDYERYKSAAEFDRGPYNYAYVVQPYEFQASIARSRGRSIAILTQAIKALEEQLGENAHFPASGDTAANDGISRSRKVFIVHGHEGEPREAVSGFLRKIDFTPVILHEQSNQGRTIVEKFEAHADVAFAVVLLTPDDIGGSKDGELKPRARQNVILELGFFIGKLGRKNVCAIKLGEVEIPSDILGVAWTPFDEHGAWKTALAKELRDAGHDIDWNKVMGP
jgi:predicted nucleotide-binding protein